MLRLFAVALLSTGCSGLGINESPSFRMKASDAIKPAFYPGGATATYVLNDSAGLPMPNVTVTSSRPEVIRVGGLTDANGEVTLTSGVEGVSNITVASLRLEIAVASASLLRRTRSHSGDPISIVSNEVVSFAVEGQGAGAEAIYGSGPITFTVDGTLQLHLQNGLDGESRVFFSGAPGEGTVRALGAAQPFAAKIVVVAADKLVIVPTITDTGESRKSVSLEVRSLDPGPPLRGGRCTWTGNASRIEDHTAVDRIEFSPVRSASVFLPDAGSVSVTCTIGQTSKEIVLR